MNVASLGPQFVAQQNTAVGDVQLLHVHPLVIALPARVNQGQQFVPSMATGSLAMTPTIGGRFVGVSKEGKTLIATGAEVPDKPLLSVANAFRIIFVSGGGFVQMNPQVLVGPT